MANQYRITTNGKRFRVEVQDVRRGSTAKDSIASYYTFWRPYGDASGVYLDREGAEEFIKFLLDMEGEWLPVADAEAVAS